MQWMTGLVVVAGTLLLACSDVRETGRVRTLGQAMQAAVLDAPSGIVLSSSPSFQWQREPEAVMWRLRVTTTQGTVVHDELYAPATAGCESSSPCSISPSLVLAEGDYEWRVWGSDPNGADQWSAPLAFTVDAMNPPSLVAPVGAVFDTSPSFSWQSQPHAAAWRVRITASGGAVIHDGSYSPEDAGCQDGSACSLSLELDLEAGTYEWRVWANNPYGADLWSPKSSFTVPTSALVALAPSGVALPIIVDTDHSPEVGVAADQLAEYLNRIVGTTGPVFEVVERDTLVLTGGAPGIAVGQLGDFDAGRAPYHGSIFDPTDPARVQEYVLWSHPAGWDGPRVTIAGATGHGVSSAVWMLLSELGYRHYFPGDKWEIIPHRINPTVDVHETTKPDLWYAQFSYSGYSPTQPDWGDIGVRKALWSLHNAFTGPDLSPKHSYTPIIDYFEAEYGIPLPPELGDPVKGVLCLGTTMVPEPDGGPSAPYSTLDLVREYTESTAGQAKFADRVPISPDDGLTYADWEHCQDGEQSVSDRVVRIANAAAEAAGNRLVTIYAYSLEYSDPPSVPLVDNVVPFVATRFGTHEASLDERFDGWRDAGAGYVGLRNYPALPSQSWDRPGSSLASRPRELEAQLRHFYQRGMGAYLGEAAASWGPHGLSYVLLARLKWNLHDPTVTYEAIRDEFIDTTFVDSDVRDPIARFYDLLDSGPLESTDLLGRLYRSLADAAGATQDALTRSRIHDLAKYVRYAELVRGYLMDCEDGLNAGRYANIVQYAYAIRGTDMVNSYWLYRSAPHCSHDDYNANVCTSAPEPETAWNCPGAPGCQALNPWKLPEAAGASDACVDDLVACLTSGVANNPILSVDLDDYEFSSELVPATPDHPSLPEIAGDSMGFEGQSPFYAWLDAPGHWSLTVVPGYARNYESVSMDIHSLADSDTWSGRGLEAGTAISVGFPGTVGGLHRITAEDYGTSFKLYPTGSERFVTLANSGSEYTQFRHRWRQYFYVPAPNSPAWPTGTDPVVAGWSEYPATLTVWRRDPVTQDWLTETVHTFGNTGQLYECDDEGKAVYEHFEIAVPSASGGQIWEFTGQEGGQPGRVVLLTVPAVMASHPTRMLLPAEVVQADSLAP